MALINCPECQKEVSDQAELCPNCGFSIKPKQIKTGISKKTKNISIALAVAIVLCGVGVIISYQIHSSNLEKERIVAEQVAVVERLAEEKRLEEERIAEEKRSEYEKSKVHPLIGKWVVTFMSINGINDDSVLGIYYDFTADGKVVSKSRTGAAISSEKWENGTQEVSGSVVEGSFDWSLYGVFTTWDFIITDSGNSATLMWNLNGDEAMRYVLTRR